MGDDFVQAELVNGVAQVTMNVGGQRRVIIPIFLNIDENLMRVHDNLEIFLIFH
ncbi:MAG: hypothetical protein AB2693_29565 [Candidatus Thiodiazotropha sp.]